MGKARLIFRAAAAGSLLFALAFAQQPKPGTSASAPVAIPDREVAKHLVGDPPYLRAALSPRQSFDLFMHGVQFKVVVNPFGSITSSRPIENDTSSATPVPAEVRDLARDAIERTQFRPFERDGHPVWATFEISASVLPPEQRPVNHIPFPKVRDWQSLRITLSRSSCFGMCPAYTVTISGDGTVTYDGRAFVAVEGRHTATIPRDQIARLLDGFRQADFFSLRDEYVSQVTDLPTYEISIHIAGRAKKVKDYLGAAVGMPMSVRKLEDAIDETADTKRWVTGDANTVDSLQAEGFDFKSPAGGHLLASAVTSGDLATVRALLAAGAPLSGGNPGLAVPAPRDVPAIVLAAQMGHEEVVQALLQAGAAADPLVKNQALVAASSSGKPALVQAILALGADPNWRTPEGVSALRAAVGAWHYGPEAPEVDRAAVARLLLEAGADPNAADEKGNTPLSEAAWDAPAVLVLIQHGADVNVRGEYGFTPLINAVDPDVVRVLLQHGADPTIRDNDGDDALQAAKKFGHKEKAEVLRQWFAGRVTH